MTTENNKAVIRKLNKGFEADSDDMILSCLADDVRWDVEGHFTAIGKSEFRDNIRGEMADGPPTITIKNEVAEGNYVAVEGHVSCGMKNGMVFKGVFHNAYYLENGLVKRMNSYVVPLSM
ncbi:nuclear transport factor 2 family protein [Flavobacterium sp.]|uniref:nuclear transport factor 2 family protein n=1 Tax=Flavobacterium sp. TaxID=239 RepID=UPI00286D11D5|nr:nuclear transport factor 2 family protein [Flavobacterium sp.]